MSLACVSKMLSRAHWCLAWAFTVLACGGVQPPNASLPAVSTRAAQSSSAAAAPRAPAHAPKVIVFVWDGLRPDSVSPEVTPNLARLRDHDGVDFRDHHSAYPTFTMMNAAAFATGAYPGEHGFYGNTEYLPGASGTNAEGKAIDFSQPVFTEDHGVLLALDVFNRKQGRAGLFAVPTLFEAAHAAGLRTATIGKGGPAFLQDFRPSEQQSVILDENVALPISFAKALQTAGFPLPANMAHAALPDGTTLPLLPDSNQPTAASSDKIVRLKDGATPDPRSALGSAHRAANQYLMQVYLEYVLPKFDPALSFVWLRTPDSTEHQFGPGSANYALALRDQDALLGQLESKLSELGLSAVTDLIVVSDHGHSTVAGDAALFPLRALQGEADGSGELGGLDTQGYAVSGELRSADLLTRAGFKHVYDGSTCLLDPVLTGIRRNGSPVYPTQTDITGACSPPNGGAAATKPKAKPTLYSLPGYRVPQALPQDAIVIAANGGSEYFYVPSHDARLVQALVSALQERPVYGAVFVHSRYSIPGTLPLAAVHAENAQALALPDLVVSLAWDEHAVAGGPTGLPGTEYASAQRYRGMHGSFSPRDIHNTLVAAGPHFTPGFTDQLPTGNVDLAPTVAALLGFDFSAPAGRVLKEALRDNSGQFELTTSELRAPSAAVRRTCSPDDPSCTHPGPATAYELRLQEKVLTDRGTHAKYTYFDRAITSRAPLTQPAR